MFFRRHLHRLLLGTLAALGGCADAPAREQPTAAAAVAVTDDAGREVRLERPATRIVSLIPSITEWVIALDAADRLAARTDYDLQPELAALPSVGGGLTPNLEWLAARRPDLVVAWPDHGARAVVGRLTGLGVGVYGARAETIEDAVRTVRHLGVLLGEPERADSLVRALEAGLDSVRAAIDGAETLRVLYVVGIDPPTIAGPGTFVDEILTIAGGRNVFADAGAQWPQISLEEALRRDPEVIVVSQMAGSAPALERLRAAPGWRELPAVRQGRVAEVDADAFNRWGPGMADAARTLAARLHPGRVELR